MTNFEGAYEIVERLKAKGHIAYFAGGWVRDHIMGHPCDDIDIATDATPAEIMAYFPKTLPVGVAFGVVIVINKGQQYEVATFRKDLEYKNGRSPEGFEHSDPEEDAKRRDFTINGMFYDPVDKQIHDFIGGREDLKKGIIRAIGVPQERFFEDRLRMIRAIRFSSRFRFPIEPETQAGIQENADTLLPAVAPERIWQEFNKMAVHPNLDYAFIEMHRLGLLPVIFSALKNVHLHEIKKRVAHWEHIPRDTPVILYFLDLFPEHSLQQLNETAAWLRCSNQEIKWLETAYKARELLKKGKGAPLVDWVYFYANPFAQTALDFLAAKEPFPQLFHEEHNQRRTILQPHIARVAEKAPLVTAAFLKEQGILPGITMGRLLKEAEEIAILHDIHEAPEVLKRLIKSEYWRPQP